MKNFEYETGIFPLVFSRSKTVHPPNCDWVLSEVSIRANHNPDILGVEFDRKLIFEDHVRGIVSRPFQRIEILKMVQLVFVDISVLLRFYYAFVLAILEYCSSVSGSAAECHLQLLKRQMYSMARLCPGQSFWSLSSTSYSWTVYVVHG